MIPGGGDCLTNAAKEIMVRAVAGAMLLRHYLLVVDVVDSLKFGLALYIMVSVPTSFAVTPKPKMAVNSCH